MTDTAMSTSKKSKKHKRDSEELTTDTTTTTANNNTTNNNTIKYDSTSISIIAKPLADSKQTKKIYKLIKKVTKVKQLRRYVYCSTIYVQDTYHTATQQQY